MRNHSTIEIEFPRGALLREHLQLSQNVKIDDLLEKSLLAPLDHLLSRPRKNLRSALVDLGVSIATEHQFIRLEQVELIARDARMILEMLHTGSLVIDDIQDGSLERRGGPAVHVIYGIPVALNAGNWMYFLPFRVIKSMAISEQGKLSLANELQDILLRAHYGQALDVGTDFTAVEQSRIAEVSHALMELKTGALSEFACKIGALVCDSGDYLTQVLARFGKKFGIALQMHDDIGNAQSPQNSRKWAEDISLKRLTFVIATAARMLPSEQFAELKQLMNDARDNHEALRSYLKTQGVMDEAKIQAQLYLASAFSELQASTFLSKEQLQTVERLQQRLMNAYE